VTDLIVCPHCERLIEPEGALRAFGIVTICPLCRKEINTVGSILGGKYEVTAGPLSTKAGAVAYTLRGLKGAEYRMIRTARDPRMMFCVRSNGAVCGLRGNTRFTDRCGYLEVLS